MWHTQNGLRTLYEGEASLIAAVVDYVIEDIGEPNDRRPARYGVLVFDRLSCGQQLAALLPTVKSLLCDQVAAPELDALNEGTIGALFNCLEQRVNAELKHARYARDPFFWRRLVLRSFDEYELSRMREGAEDAAEDGEQVQFPPNLAVTARIEWEALVDAARGRILFDADYEMVSMFEDQDDGNEDDYYCFDHPDEPTVAEWLAIKADLKAILENHLKHPV